MEKIRLLERIDDSQSLFSLPPTLGEILEAVESEDSNPDQIATAILKDVSLTAKVLKMANSSFYRREAEITTVKHAVRVLGANAVRCIALSVSVFSDNSSDALGDYDIRELYSHCLGVGILSKAIANKLKTVNREEAFVAGLLHDLGRLFIVRAFPWEFVEIEKRVASGKDVITVEREIFDVDHAELGSVIAGRWHLPESLQRVLRSHHHLDSSDTDDLLCETVKLANVLTNSIYSKSTKQMERHIESISLVSENLGLKREFVNSLTFVLLDETIKAASSVGINLGDSTELLNRANQELCKTYLTVEQLFRERQELSAKMLDEERLAGMVRSKNIAIATLSHYLNNVATAVSGRVQLLQMALDSGQLVDKQGKTDAALKVIDNSIIKILAVLAELKSLSRFDDQNFYNDSDALNIDSRIQERMKVISETLTNP